MPKLINILRIKSNKKMTGFIYVINNESVESYDFTVKININNQKLFNDIEVKNVSRYSDGGTTIIELIDDNFKQLYIPSPFNKQGVPYREFHI